MTYGPEFYDDPEVFQRYIELSQYEVNSKDVIEKPAFMELLGDFHNASILDLGCGDGHLGVELLKNGCRTYMGVEASTNMVQLARENLAPVRGHLVQSTIENWMYPEHSFDIVLSRLVLHYIQDIEPVFQCIFHTLKPGGRFIFSILHPVITSSNRSATASGLRYDWIVDDYFVTGKRDVDWLKSRVVQYHRTIEDYFLSLQRAGFTISSLREPRPISTKYSDKNQFQRKMRIPLFLLFSTHR